MHRNGVFNKILEDEACDCVPAEQRDVSGKLYYTTSTSCLILIALKFNFQDHTKLLLSQDGTIVTYIDEKYKLWTWHLTQMMRPELTAQGRERRRMEKAMGKLEYAR